MPRASPLPFLLSFFFFFSLFCSSVGEGGEGKKQKSWLAYPSNVHGILSPEDLVTDFISLLPSLSLSVPLPLPLRSFVRSLVRWFVPRTRRRVSRACSRPKFQFPNPSPARFTVTRERGASSTRRAPGMRESTDDPRHVASRRVASTRGLRANRLAWASARARSRATFEKGVTTPCVSTRAPPKPGRLFSSFHYLPHSLSLSLCFYLAASMFIITCHDDSILDRNSHVCFSHDFLTQFLFPHHVTIFFFSLEKNRVEETFAVCLPPRRKKRKTFPKMFVVEHRITCTYIYIYILHRQHNN